MSLSNFPRLSIPEGQFYACTGCGKCCTSGWLVYPSEKKAGDIRATTAYRRLKNSGYVPLPTVDQKITLGRDEGGHCIFHENGGCELHREGGSTAKPLACQSYPFQFTEVGGVHFVSLAYSCPAVLAGLGEPLAELKEELGDLVARHPEVALQAQSTPEGFPLTLDSHATWEGYLRVEAELLKFDPYDPVVFLLNAATAILAQRVTESKLDVEALDFSLSHRLLTDAVDTLPIIAGACISVIEREEDPVQRETFCQDFMAGKNPRSHLLDAPCPLFAVLKPESELMRRTLARYLRNLLEGKRLLLGKSVVSRLLMIAVSISILLYYYRFRSLLHGTGPFDFTHLEWAVETVELNFVTHSHDMEPYFLQFEKSLSSIARVHLDEPRGAR